MALARHRATISIELEILAKKFDRFGWDRDRDNGCPIQDRLLLDWMDALQDYPLDEIQAACKTAILENPGKMPNEGHVRSQIIKRRAKLVNRSAQQDDDQAREKCPPDVAKAILAAAGFAPKTFGGAE